MLASDFFAIVAAYYTTLLIRCSSQWGEEFFTALNRLLDVRDTGMLGGEFLMFYVMSAPRIILFMSATLFLLYAALLYVNRLTCSSAS